MHKYREAFRAKGRAIRKGRQVKPHSTFELYRPDEVAETFEGVPDHLITRLWELVPLYTKHDWEWGPPDVGTNCLADFWDRLTRDEQLALNELAVEREEEERCVSCDCVLAWYDLNPKNLCSSCENSDET